MARGRYKAKIFSDNVKIDSFDFDSVDEFELFVKRRLRGKGL